MNAANKDGEAADQGGEKEAQFPHTTSRSAMALMMKPFE